MPILDKPDWQYLNDEVCFDAWNANSSSLRKAQLQLVELGYVNPSTGNPPTPMGIRVAALRFAIANPEEARHRIKDAGGRLGEITPFYRWLVASAAGVLSRKKFFEWVGDNDLWQYVPGKYQREISNYTVSMGER